MIPEKTKNICMTMREIYSNESVRNSLPHSYLRSKLLVDEVFGENVFDYITFKFIDGCDTGKSSVEFDHDYAAVRWSMVPVLINIAANSLHKINKRFVPVMIEWVDKGEDDRLKIYCADQDQIGMEQRLDRDSVIWETNLDEDSSDDVYCYIGIIGEQGLSFEELSIKDLPARVQKKIKAGYEPLVIQKVIDDEDEGVVCYWMVTPEKEKLPLPKVKPRRISREKRPKRH